MSQQRLIVFGSLVETDDLPTVAANLFSPGRLVGNTLEVAGVDLIRITPGSVLLPDGVLILEDEARTLPMALPSFNASYTVVYQLEDSTILGGSPAILRIVPGLMKQSDFEKDAVVVGWIKYPGGSVPLNKSFFSQPKPIRVLPTTTSFYYQAIAPFVNAVRPQAETSGSVSAIPYPVADLGAPSSSTLVLSAGVASRIVSSTVYVQAGVTDSTINYMIYQIKKGAQVLFSHDTRPIPFGQGPIAYGVPVTLLKNSMVAQSNFTVSPTETLTFVALENGAVPSSSGVVTVLTETPASTGVWKETTALSANEYVTRFENTSSSTSTYTLAFPFIIPSEGSPAKVVTRLSVDFNCILTLSLSVGGVSIPLDPNAGIIANTGTLVTREFDVPSSFVGATWTPAKTAFILVEINAQPGRGASIAHMTLTLEPTPFQLF